MNNKKAYKHKMKKRIDQVYEISLKNMNTKMKI
jgi:hypothetical protein